MSSPGPGQRLQGLRLLLAEDNDDAREILEVALTSRGATVRTASNGAEAIALLVRERPDAVVTDLSMPFTDGGEVLKATREVLGNAPCVAVTAFASTRDREATLQAGFDAHFGKPVDYRQLADALATLIEARAPSTSGVRRRRNARSLSTPKRHRAK